MNTARLLIMALCLAATGCLSAPDRSVEPQLRADVPVMTTEAAPAARWPLPSWWLQYQSAALTQLVERALASSPDIAAAQARFEQASASVRLAAAASGVKLDANATLARQRLSDNGLLPPQLLGFNWYSSADLGLNARYSFDWWGKLAAGRRTAESDLQAAAAERDVASLTLASAVAESYFGWQTDNARIDLAQLRVVELERNLRIVRAQQRAELAGGDEFERANHELLDAFDHRNSLETSRRLRLVTLAALLGCLPAELPDLQPAPLPEIRTELPPDVSLNLMSRRPDLRASRWRIESAAANVETARAGFLPDISLNALLGFSSRQLGELLDTGSLAPAFSAAVNLPLFDGGRLRAQHAREQARLAAAVATYHAALVAAAREVNTGLTERAAWTGQLQLRDAQLASAGRRRALADGRLRSGVTDARPVVRATLEWLTASDTRVITRFAQLSSDLALIRALGGGYDTGN